MTHQVTKDLQLNEKITKKLTWWLRSQGDFKAAVSPLKGSLKVTGNLSTSFLAD